MSLTWAVTTLEPAAEGREYGKSRIEPIFNARQISKLGFFNLKSGLN